MNAVPLVSVVLPVYNAETYLAEAVESILGQTLSDLELIVVDDASTDDSVAVARSFSDPRIRIIEMQANGGYATAMNAGLATASGKYIARMDADDVSMPSRLERQVRLLERCPDFVFVGATNFFLTPNGKRISGEAVEGVYRVETWEDVIEGSRRFVDPSVVVSRASIQQVGGYRTYQRTGQDIDLWLRLLELGRPMATLLEPLYGWRLSPTSISFSAEALTGNKIPRLLARERRNKGTDTVMRNEPIDFLAPFGEANGASHPPFYEIWKVAHQCLVAGDFAGGMSFITHVARTGKYNRRLIGTGWRYLRGRMGLNLPAVGTGQPKERV